MSLHRITRGPLPLFAVAVIVSACTSTTEPPSPTTTGPASTTSTILEATTTSTTTDTSITTTSEATAPPRSAEETVRVVVSALNEGDVAEALAAFAPDALWEGFLGRTRMDDSLPDEILLFSESLGLTQGATFGDLWAANFELLVAARTMWTIESCDVEGMVAVCELRGTDAFSALSGGEHLGVFEVETGVGGLVDRFRFDTDWSETPTERFDDFHRWVKLERPEVDPQSDPFATRALVELLDQWESLGSPAIEPPDPDLDAVEVVEAYLAARNDQDWETHVRLLGGDALGNPFGSYDEFLATGALDRRIVAHDCTVTAVGGESFVACSVDVTDIITAAAGRTPTNLNASTFGVRNGRVVDLPEFLPSLFLAEQAIEQWATANEPERYATACPFGIAGQDVITGRSCADFIAEFQEEWQAAVAAVY